MQQQAKNLASQQLNVKVVVRVRPKQWNETKGKKPLETKQNQIGFIQDERFFSFDHVYDSHSTQDQIFEQCGVGVGVGVVSGLVMRCFEGFNATLLAYGQTGSGKTYTMGTSDKKQQDDGMIPRVAQLIFQEIDKRKQIQDITISCSYLELYQEELIDLLGGQNKFKPIIREEKNNAISIKNLTSFVITNSNDMLQMLHKGGKLRQTAPTLMNETSSRSHAIFTIYFKINQNNDNEIVPLSAKFHFVNLAGSERLKKTKAQGRQQEEGIMINSSLLSLGNVIEALTKKKQHIPYRDSILTRILQDSLGGNTNTCMIACVSPSENNYEETLNTLQYACKARKIQNQPIQNIDPQVAQIMKLKQQINMLQLQIQSYAQKLKENNLEVKEIQQPETQYLRNCEDHQELINNLRYELFQLQKEYDKQKQQFEEQSKQLQKTEIDLFVIKEDNYTISKQVTYLQSLLENNNIDIGQNQIHDSVSVDQYQTEISSLKTALENEIKQKGEMKETIDQLLVDQKIDLKILFRKQNQIIQLERRIKIYSELLPDYEFSDQCINEDDYMLDENLRSTIKKQKKFNPKQII